MKKILAYLFVLLYVFSFTGCSGKEASVWEWAQGFCQEDIVCATPWNQDKRNQNDAFAPLDDQENLELVTLLNALTKDNFTHNKHLRGGTPTYGLKIALASETYHLNQANGPYGALEVSYNGKLWWIDDAELSAFVQRVTTEDPTQTEQIVVDTIPKLVISHGEEIIDVPRIGVASWEYTKADGTQGALNGDGAHPLDAKHSSPFFVLDPYSEMPFEIWLGWELEPDSVLVRYWDESCWGQLDAEPVGRELLQKAASPVNRYRLVPQEGNYIYEVIATWKNAPAYSGSVNYNFHTVLTDRVPTDQEIYEKYISEGEKGKYQYVDVDADGKQELFIARSHGESELVTISDEQIVRILYEYHLFLCEGGIIGRWGEGSGGQTMIYYKIQNMEPVIVDVVVCPSNELNWYHSSDADVQLGTTKGMECITKEEGQNICGQYVPVDNLPGGAASFYPEEGISILFAEGA